MSDKTFKPRVLASGHGSEAKPGTACMAWCGVNFDGDCSYVIVETFQGLALTYHAGCLVAELELEKKKLSAELKRKHRLLLEVKDAVEGT